MSEDKDQDALAAEWEAALAAQGDTEEVSGGDADQPVEASGGDEPVPETAAAPSEPAVEKLGDDDLAAGWAAALAETEQKNLKQEKAKKAEDASKAREVSFVDLTDEAKTPSSDDNRKDLDFILDIPLDVSAELGRARLLINELLQLGQGSVVELNKLAGEPLEVYVNGKIIARGEAVVINEKFGIRLTDIISPIERVKQLG